MINGFLVSRGGDKFEFHVVNVGPMCRAAYLDEYKLHRSSVIPVSTKRQEKTRIHLSSVLRVVTPQRADIL